MHPGPSLAQVFPASSLTTLKSVPRLYLAFASFLSFRRSHCDLIELFLRFYPSLSPTRSNYLPRWLHGSYLQMVAISLHLGFYLWVGGWVFICGWVGFYLWVGGCGCGVWCVVIACSPNSNFWFNTWSNRAIEIVILLESHSMLGWWSCTLGSSTMLFGPVPSGFATLGKDVPDMNPFPWDSMMHVDAR